MNFEQKGILFGVIAAFVIVTGGYTAKILIDDVPRASNREFMRAKADQNEIRKVKCNEPMSEFRIAETNYLSTYGLLFSPASKYDILSADSNDNNKQQKADATELKLNEELAVQSCVDANAETEEIKQAGNWDYFKAHYKEMLFNAK